VLSATIDRFAYGSLEPRADRTVTVESVDFKTSAEMSLDEEIACDGSLDLIKAAVRRFGRDTTDGYDLVLRSNAPPGSGLGASSTMMVALTGLLPGITAWTSTTTTPRIWPTPSSVTT
jgi:D-glycero-alpha-D-manno-heptose-7-phosphate kinase